MKGRGSSEALGYVGPVCRGQLGPDGEKVEVVCVANSVGRAHAWAKQFASAGVRRQLTRFALPEPLTPKP